MQVDLRAVAFTRAGDKGNTSNIVVAPYDERDYEWLLKHLTPAVVKKHFQAVVSGPITRYEMPGSRMLNFVMEDALQGGVSRSLNLDMHGKSRASLMLSLLLNCGTGDGPPSGRGVLS